MKRPVGNQTLSYKILSRQNGRRLGRAKASVLGRGHRRWRVRSGLKCSAPTIARLTTSHAANEKRILITNSYDENAGEVFVFHAFRRTRRSIGLSEAPSGTICSCCASGASFWIALSLSIRNLVSKPWGERVAHSRRRYFPAPLSGAAFLRILLRRTRTEMPRIMSQI